MIDIVDAKFQHLEAGRAQSRAKGRRPEIGQVNLAAERERIERTGFGLAEALAEKKVFLVRHGDRENAAGPEE